MNEKEILKKKKENGYIALFKAIYLKSKRKWKITIRMNNDFTNALKEMKRDNTTIWTLCKLDYSDTEYQRDITRYKVIRDYYIYYNNNSKSDYSNYDNLSLLLFEKDLFDKKIANSKRINLVFYTNSYKIVEYFKNSIAILFQFLAKMSKNKKKEIIVKVLEKEAGK